MIGLGIYSYSPYLLKCWMASWRGKYLNNWRYDNHTQKLVRDAEEREFWLPDQWREYHDDKLKQIIHSSKKTPFYQQMGYSFKGNKLSQFPILSKELLRENNQDFVVNTISKKKLFHDHTSGSSGTPVSVWLDERSIKFWYALVERRWRNWYDVSRDDKWAIFGGQLITPQKRTKPPFWVENYSMKQLYCSIYHISSRSARYYVEKLTQFKPAYIYGYASALYSLAYEMEKQNLLVPSLKVVISNAEPLHKHQRELISTVFNAPCKDTYGLAEIVMGAGECEFNQMHLWPETGIWEVLDKKGVQVKNGVSGRFVSTGLINTCMPLLRYNTGDHIAIDKNYSCKCGRTMPVIIKIDGRTDDLIVTPDGRSIGRLDTVFKSDLNIKEAQIIQNSANSLIIRIVPARKYSKIDEEKLENALKLRLGKMEIFFELVNNIPKNNSGKFQAVISEIN